jgi:phosphatidylserine decarboxylase
MRNEKTPIAVEGLPFIALTGCITITLFLFECTTLAIVGLAVTLFIAFFFRNPARIIPPGENAVLAPADGVVIYLGDANEKHLGDEMTKISIFMSVFNVHINRAPVSGRVVDIFYNKGKFLDVRDSRATFENEQSGIIIETVRGVKLVVVQVAGLIARRIVCYPVKGDSLKRGERFGLIRFGSRLDVYLPKNTEPKVAIGDKTVGGETILGILA